MTQSQHLKVKLNLSSSRDGGKRPVCTITLQRRLLILNRNLGSEPVDYEVVELVFEPIITDSTAV